MEIISAAFEYEKEYGESRNFKIVLFQHDGVCLSINNKQKDDIQKEFA
jgi:hypothetical protein